MYTISKAKYFAIRFKVAIELGLAAAGKEGVCPNTTPNGTRVLDAVLLHEEGHVVLDAVPECGWTMLSSELACDEYMRVRVTTKECMAFLAMLEYLNPHMIKSGQVEAYNTNLSRMHSLKSYLGV